MYYILLIRCHDLSTLTFEAGEAKIGEVIMGIKCIGYNTKMKSFVIKLYIIEAFVPAFLCARVCCKGSSSNPHTLRAAFALRALTGSLLSHAVASPRFISLFSRF